MTVTEVVRGHFGLLFSARAVSPCQATAGVPVLLVIGLAISSAGNLFTGLAWAVWTALALQTIRELGIAALDVAINTYLQRVVPAAMLGRVFGNLYGAIGR